MAMAGAEVRGCEDDHWHAPVPALWSRRGAMREEDTMAKIIESFETIAETPNSPLSQEYGDYGFLQPGYLGAYRFPSGIRLLDPVPNDAVGLDEVLIGDFDRPTGPTWGLGGRDGLKNVGQVPDGSAYIGRNQIDNGTLSFGIDRKVYSASAAVTAADEGLSGRVGVVAYDSSGQVIVGARIDGVGAGDWKDNGITVTSDVPIAKLVFTGNYLILDKLTLDTAKPSIVKGSSRADNLSTKADGIGKSADVVLARGGNDTVKAKGGGDTVKGGDGRDKLHGGKGDDALHGGTGRDKLWGGAGQDTFLFREIDAVDVMKDFAPGVDSILLDVAVFARLTRGTLLPGQFNDGSSAIDAETRILYDKETGVISYDRDGDGGAAAVAFARVKPGLALSHDDFFGM